MKTVQELLIEIGSDMDQVKKELKRVASIKSRLKKQIGKQENKLKLVEVEQYEEVLKEVRDMLSDRKKFVTEYTWEDIERLDYEEVCRAINSIKSKKSLSRWLTSVEGDNDEYRNAEIIEEMLYKRKEMFGDVQKVTIKYKLKELIDMSSELTKEELVEMLKELV